MEMIKFCIKDFKDLFNKESNSILIVIISLAITFSALIILVKAMILSNESISKANIQKRSFYISGGGGTQEDIELSYKFVDMILNGENMPSIEKRGTILVKGIVPLEKNRNYYMFSAEAILESENELNNEDKRVQGLEGKWFSKEELKSDKKNIILSKIIKDQYFPKASIGDEIDISGNTFNLLGITLYESSFIPYSCIKRLKNCVTEIDYVRFSKKLSGKQIKELKSLLSQISKNGEIKSEYEINAVEYYLNYILYTIIIALVVVFCLLNVMSLFKYLAVSRMYDFNIYKICGISPRQIYIWFYVQMLIIAAIGYSIGILIYNISIPIQKFFEIKVNISKGSIGILALLVSILLVATISPIIHKLVKRPPVDRLFWS